MRTYFSIFAVLVLLLGVTVGVAYVPLGPLNVGVALLIASVKAGLVIWFFMHLGESPRLSAVFLGAAGVALLISAVLTMSDYMARV